MRFAGQAQPFCGHILHTRSCVRRDYPSEGTEIAPYCTKVAACLADMMQVGVGEIPFRHQAMSYDIHQDPRYYMSACLVSFIIVSCARSSAPDLATLKYLACSLRYDGEREVATDPGRTRDTRLISGVDGRLIPVAFFLLSRHPSHTQIYIQGGICRGGLTPALAPHTTVITEDAV